MKALALTLLLAAAAHGADVVDSMHTLFQARQWKELVAQFGAEDFSALPAERMIDALQVRGQAYALVKDGTHAKSDLEQAARLAPRNAAIWISVGDNYVNNLANDEQALAAYRKALDITGPSQGWQPLTASISIARILTSQLKTDDALATLQRCGAPEAMATSWRIRFLRMYGHINAARGEEQESLANFREALRLEAQP